MKVQETSIQSKWSKEAGELEIKLSANQFQLNRMKQYRFFLESTAHLAQGAVKEEAEEVVRLSYQIPAGYQSIRTPSSFSKVTILKRNCRSAYETLYSPR